jgi:lantibiotic modifying enzyme
MTYSTYTTYMTYAIVFFVLLIPGVTSMMAASNDTGFDGLNLATRAADWILTREVREPGDQGSYWPSREDLPLAEKCDFYYGNAGTLLFLRELEQAAGPGKYADAERRGVHFLAQNVSLIKLFGFYDGLAGIAFSLAQQSENREAMTSCSEALDRLIREAVRGADGGVRWNDDNDIMSGSAGIGLALLVLGKQLHRSELVDLAVRAGTDLLGNSKISSQGRYWLHQLDAKKEYPNFSHGTAGVGYFLLKLYEQTGEQRFLDATNDAAKYLRSIASKDPATNCLVPHEQPEGKDLFYLGWCHGPAGTGRFFHELFVVTNEAQWQTFEGNAAASVLRSGIPERETAGYWNNLSRCCGAVSVGEFFLARYRITGNVAERQFAVRIGKYLVGRAETDGDGLKWIQAENRIEPDKLIAQTGLMQGAAGIGLFFIHLADLDENKRTTVRFPDSPW